MNILRVCRTILSVYVFQLFWRCSTAQADQLELNSAANGDIFAFFEFLLQNYATTQIGLIVRSKQLVDRINQNANINWIAEPDLKMSLRNNDEKQVLCGLFVISISKKGKLNVKLFYFILFIT